MDLIAVGQSVNIKRTDGRVHSAIVSRINESGTSIMVEWSEREEIKGKEVELSAILSLNSEILQAGETERRTAPQPKKQPTATNISNLSRNAAYTGIGHGTNRARNHATSKIPSPSTTRDHSSNNKAPLHGTGMLRSRSTNSNRQPSAASTSHAGQAGGAAGGSRSNNRGNSPSIVSSSVGVTMSARRSFVVKEVERLKENREKRRARQAEMKEEKVALMNQDPGNPNWETARMIREYQCTLEFNPLVDGHAHEEHQITVCVRKRPLSRKENNRKEIDVISVPRKNTLIVHEPRNKVDLTKFLENHKFRFDYAFDDHCDNAVVYKYTAKPLVQTILEGGMATCFAYGQTGSGKTHTMGGEFSGKVQDCNNGIYAMAARDVFTFLHTPRYRNLQLVVSASFFEIYSGKVFDLLAFKQKLRVLEDGKQQIQVMGLTEKVVDSVDEVLKLIQHGNSARTSGQTSANANSSRSHAVFQIVLRPPGTTEVHGKFSFIDLAGNERGADTSSSNRHTRMEGAEINKSLLALKECIRALGKQSAHLPFRVSKLTQVLRDSFIGENSKTCMIAMISPGLSSCEHTLNTLRYADRVKELVVKELNPDVPRQEHSVRIMEEEDDYISDEDNNNINELVSQNGINHNNNSNVQLDDNNLTHIRSLSENDISEEMLVQHAALSELQQIEEMVVDQHRVTNEFLSQFLPESIRLYQITNYVDYDQDMYCKQGEALFSQLAELSVGFRDMMANFRSKLAKEEMLSCTIKPSGQR